MDYVVYFTHMGMDPNHSKSREQKAPTLPQSLGKSRRPHWLPSPQEQRLGCPGVAPRPYFPDVLFIHERIEDTPISDDEPTLQGEEPPQHETLHHRNRRQNARCHHTTREWDPIELVSRDEAYEAGEPLMSWRSTNSGTLGDEAATSPRIMNGNWQNIMPRTGVMTRLIPKTCCLTPLGPCKRRVKLAEFWSRSPTTYPTHQIQRVINKSSPKRQTISSTRSSKGRHAPHHQQWARHAKQHRRFV